MKILSIARPILSMLILTRLSFNNLVKVVYDFDSRDLPGL